MKYLVLLALCAMIGCGNNNTPVSTTQYIVSGKYMQPSHITGIRFQYTVPDQYILILTHGGVVTSIIVPHQYYDTIVVGQEYYME